jgi:hypothetical protein
MDEHPSPSDAPPPGPPIETLSVSRLSVEQLGLVIGMLELALVARGDESLRMAAEKTLPMLRDIRADVGPPMGHRSPGWARPSGAGGVPRRSGADLGGDAAE